MTEAAMLSAVGALTGYRLGQIGASPAPVVPGVPAHPPDWAVIAGLSTAIGTGLLFGIMPGAPRRQARSRCRPDEALNSGFSPCSSGRR